MKNETSDVFMGLDGYIISDGEDHQEETKQLAQNISNDGIKVKIINYRETKRL